MPPDTTDAPARPGSSGWADAPARDALQLIAEGLTELAGFGVAAISVARDPERMEVMAVAGNEAAREMLEGTHTPVSRLMDELSMGDDWGMFKFVPHERLSIDLEAEAWGWVPDLVPLEVEGAWHPLDLLVAPLYDDQGTLQGSLSIDLPADGMRPGPAQRRMLNKYAEQAARAIMVAVEREDLAEQVRMASAARRVVRNATSRLSLATLVEECRDALLEGFRARGLWIRTFEDAALGDGEAYSGDGNTVPLPPRQIAIAESSARLRWAEQEVHVLRRGAPLPANVTARVGGEILDYLATIGIASIMFVPLGAAEECLGMLVLTRAEQDPDWTEVESQTALDIGHDLGRAILNARAFEREQQLVGELQALDSYKSELIATVSHELKSPLTSILGNLELLEQAPGLNEQTRKGLDAVDRGAQRLVRVVDDLLLLAKVGDPANPLIPVPVDLKPIVEDVRELTAVAAQRRDLTVTVTAPDHPVLAMGDATELDRVVTNLVSNAVKYTPQGRGITVTLSRDDEGIVIACEDEGIGISKEDQELLFTEFFRSTNPVATAQPGTGLGLAIVERIVTRHGGRIELVSELGIGSTFVVHLPAA